MQYRKTASILLLLLVVIGVVWSFNFPMYEHMAEKRIHTYMEAQGIDEKQLSDKSSFKDWMQGRWEIYYQFMSEEVDEHEIAYHYTYDRSQDRVHLTIVDRGVPLDLVSSEMGADIQDYAYLPPALNPGAWTGFDIKGNIILNPK